MYSIPYSAYIRTVHIYDTISTYTHYTILYYTMQIYRSSAADHGRAQIPPPYICTVCRSSEGVYV